MKKELSNFAMKNKNKSQKIFINYSIITKKWIATNDK